MTNPGAGPDQSSEREARRPFEVDVPFLKIHLDEMVQVTISDLVSEFLLMPKGPGFVEYPDFRDAFEVLKRHTRSFTEFSTETVRAAIRENSRSFNVLRSILGMTPPEWADLARSELASDIDQSAARGLDRSCRVNPGYVQDIERRCEERRARAATRGKAAGPNPKSLERFDALVEVAVLYIMQGVPPGSDGLIHRLAKFDTKFGLDSVRHAANEGVPYAELLYERYLGRPFAGHRDAVSELVGEVMENAIEDRLGSAGITYRKTKHAERIPGYDQAPDFCIPDETSPTVIIEAKITSDDGTARDKVTRIKTLATQRDQHLAEGRRSYQVVACIDGRGFRERREDMRQMLLALDGKVFTAATLDQLIPHTELRRFVTR